MKTRLIPLSIAVAAALMTSSSALEAASLGPLRSVSALGASFRAEIALVGGGADAACFRVVAPLDGGDIPALADGRISVVGSGRNARLVVLNARRINDPIIRLVVENQCESRLQREYTLLMPFAGAPAADATPARAQAPRPAPSARPARTEARPRPAARPQPRAASPGRTWNTAAGESLASLAESLYPDNAAARQRFVDATAAANPALFADPAAHSRVLPAGTALTVPDLRTVANATPATKPRPAAPARNVPAASSARTDRLVVDKGESAATPPTASVGKSADPNDLLAREQALAEAIDRSIIAEMQLLARIKELEEIQAQLEARIRAAVKASATATAAPAPSAAVSLPAAAPPAAAVAQTPAGSGDDWYVFGGLGLASLLLAFALLRGRNTSDARTPRHSTAARTARDNATVPATKGSSTRRARTDDVLYATAGNAPITVIGHTSAKPTQRAATDVAAQPPREVVAEEHKSAVELAEIMMSFGRVQGAADTLAEFIRGNPRDAVTPWLKLLEVYRAAGLHEEFETIANELNKTFNVTTVHWNNYETLRDARVSIEDLPHIAETVQQTWATSACQRYLQHLLRDNRDGTRAGLPFTVVDEILTLAAVLEDRLGPYKDTTTQRGLPAVTQA